MNDKNPDVTKLPPLSPEQISQYWQGLNIPQQSASEKGVPVMVVGEHVAPMEASQVASLAEPWIRDAKAHGPALQAAIDRYQKVYSKMQWPRAGNTCIVMRQGAMTAAIELYGSLVAEQQLRDGAVTGKKQSSPGNPVNKGFSVAAAYHNTIAKEYMVEESRLKRIFDEYGDAESLELAKVALEHVQMHLGFAQDMLWMAMGEKPQKIDDPFGEFAKTVARLLR